MKPSLKEQLINKIIMEEITWKYEMQAWHPDMCEDHHLVHIYGRINDYNMAFMMTLKIFWDRSYHINNTFTINKYKALEEHFVNMNLKKLSVKNR